MTTTQDVQNSSTSNRSGYTVRFPTVSAARSGPAAAGGRVVPTVVVAFVAGAALNVLLLVVAAIILTNVSYGWVSTTTAVCAALGLVVVHSVRSVTGELADSADSAPTPPTAGDER